MNGGMAATAGNTIEETPNSVLGQTWRQRHESLCYILGNIAPSIVLQDAIPFRGSAGLEKLHTMNDFTDVDLAFTACSLYGFVHQGRYGLVFLLLERSGGLWHLVRAINEESQDVRNHKVHRCVTASLPAIGIHTYKRHRCQAMAGRSALYRRCMVQEVSGIPLTDWSRKLCSSCRINS